MPLVEKLGSFYLGKEYDLAAGQVLEQPVNYDSRDLTTHAVCVGMTGSGKTGLCISLLEEAAIDGVPAIIIDPKGDMTNLLLTFPELRPEDFLPWINADDARRKGMSLEEYAAQTAQTWREGLAAWEEGPERIRLLKESADFAIYTPGSEAGLPISILSSFRAPELDWEVEAETLRDRVQGTVSALLGLIGIEADPIQSREHILLSHIIENAWRAGEDLDIAKLILAVQKPPFRTLGVLDVESFFPEKERFSLALMLNNIIASPSFGAWLKGEPLDIPGLLHTHAGKPRHSIFYIAHLNDAERMFFVTILLEQIISWMRTQPGTTSLRALVYMDEIFGFFPPVAQPPSKRPMLTLLKQARAFGLGMMLTTQNPVDLDYKGLTNAGTWFIGKLQAERDKARLLDGLQSAAAEGQGLGDPQALATMITALDNRVFLLHNVHADGPVVFNTRWAMSYLRGPLTRQQIKQLMAGRKGIADSQPVTTAGPFTAVTPRAESASVPAPAKSEAVPRGLSAQPPVLPPGVPQVYLPVTLAATQATLEISSRAGAAVAAQEERLVYEPCLIGFASVHFVDRKRDVDETRDYALLAPVEDRVDATIWKNATRLEIQPRDLEDAPTGNAFFSTAMPAGVTAERGLSKLSSDLADYLYRSEGLTLASNPTLKLYARAGESERDFLVRCQQAAREARDAAVDALRDKYDIKISRIKEKLRREEQDLQENKAQYQGRMGEEILSGLATVAGALGVFGRKTRSARSLSTAASKRRMSSAAKARIEESEADIAQYKAQIDELKSELEDEALALTEEWANAVNDIQQVRIAPRKSDVRVQKVALAWAPVWEIDYEDFSGRRRSETVAAHASARTA